MLIYQLKPIEIDEYYKRFDFVYSLEFLFAFLSLFTWFMLHGIACAQNFIVVFIKLKL